MDEKPAPYEPPQQAGTRAAPVGPGRRVAGWCLVALGVVLVSHGLWGYLDSQYMTAMGLSPERFLLGSLWQAFVVIAGGWWLAFKSRRAGWAFTVGLLAGGAIFFAIDCFWPER